MKIVYLIVCILTLIPLIGCGYNQADLDTAYQQGYQEGYKDGQQEVTNLSPEAPEQEPPLLYVVHGGANLWINAVYGYDGSYYHCRWCEVYLEGRRCRTDIEWTEQWFHTPEEAEAAGFKPCPICNPP